LLKLLAQFQIASDATFQVSAVDILEPAEITELPPFILKTLAPQSPSCRASNKPNQA
jgi:hypothetical protein